MPIFGQALFTPCPLSKTGKGASLDWTILRCARSCRAGEGTCLATLDPADLRGDLNGGD